VAPISPQRSSVPGEAGQDTSSSLEDQMRSLHRVLIGVVTLVMPASLAAQKLTAGTWTGTISPPDNATLEATFDVRMAGDTTKITMKADGREIEVSDVKVEASRLLFAFTPGGNTIRCTLLLRDDKSYSGDCLDPQGGKGVIVMKPPK
jgi:hypothetical protein